MSFSPSNITSTCHRATSPVHDVSKIRVTDPGSTGGSETDPQWSIAHPPSNADALRIGTDHEPADPFESFGSGSDPGSVESEARENPEIRPESVTESNPDAIDVASDPSSNGQYP
jgi:hypothetical protein